MSSSGGMVSVGAADSVGGAVPDPVIGVEVLPGLLDGRATLVDISERGQVVGHSVAETFPFPLPDGGVELIPRSHATLWDDGGPVDLTPSVRFPSQSAASAVSDTGRVVGVTESFPGTAEGFVWRAGELVELPQPAPDVQVKGVDVNNRGQVLVNRGPVSAVAAGRAAVWEDGEIVEAPDLADGRRMWGVDINDRGVVAGTAHVSVDDVDTYRAVVWRPGRAPMELGTLGGPSSAAVAINDRGQVLGFSVTAAQELRMFLWHRGRMIDLGTLGGTHTSPAPDFGFVSPSPGGYRNLLNERGHVAGWSQTATGEGRAFLWRSGRMTDLGTLRGEETRARALNELDQVVGTTVAAFPGGAFVWQHGRMGDLGAELAPGQTAHEAVDINNRGQVIGTGTETGVGERGYVWTVPFLWGLLY